MTDDGKPEKVFRLGLWWDAQEWDEFELARASYNEEQHLDLGTSAFLRYVVRRHLGEMRVASVAAAAEEQRSGQERRRAAS